MTDQNGTTHDYGQVIDQNWLDTTSCSPAPTSSERFQYAYDQGGNVLEKDNLIDGAESELYHANSTTSGDDNTAYDPLGRLTSFERGTLSASTYNGGTLDTIASPSASQTFTLDAVGNQSSVSTNGATAVSNTANSRNQLTTDGSSSLTYDNDGNTTKDQSGDTYRYNAWNQISAVYSAAGPVRQVYSYDALGRRVGAEGGADSHDFEDLYYSSQGQVLEDIVLNTCHPTTPAISQYVWNTDYVNDLLLRDDNSTSGDLGISGSGLGERIYALHDANFDVTALTDASGNVLERFVYSAYGVPTVLDGSFSPTTDAYNWQVGFQGMQYNAGTGLYHTINRDLNPVTGTWLEADPAGYVDGSSLYQAELDNPVSMTDPAGLQAREQPAATPSSGPTPGPASQPVPLSQILNGLDSPNWRIREQAQAQLQQALAKNPQLLSKLDRTPLSPEQNLIIDQCLANTPAALQAKKQALIDKAQADLKSMSNAALLAIKASGSSNIADWDLVSKWVYKFWQQMYYNDLAAIAALNPPASQPSGDDN